MTTTRFAGWLQSAVLLLPLALFTGCAMAPGIRGADNVALRLSARSDLDLDIVNVAGPEARPGNPAGGMARQGLRHCSDADASVSSLAFAPSCAEISATAGATMDTVANRTTTLPEQKAADLNSATLYAMTGTNWQAVLEGSLREEAGAVGKNVVPIGYGLPMSVEVSNLEWTVSAGDTVAMHATVVIVVRGEGHAVNRKEITVQGKRMGVEAWTANGGTAIRDGLRELIGEASRKIWETVTG